MSWSYVFSRHTSHGAIFPCQQEKCSSRAVYRLNAEDGEKKGIRDFCTNHAAASSFRLGLSFPPIGSNEIK